MALGSFWLQDPYGSRILSREWGTQKKGVWHEPTGELGVAPANSFRATGGSQYKDENTGLRLVGCRDCWLVAHANMCGQAARAL